MTETAAAFVAGQYPLHELCELFPPMDERGLTELAEDIRRHKLRESIVLYENAVLDGRSRLRACEMAEVSPHFRVYEGSDPLGFVLSKNIFRRHLTPSQRAMIVARALDVYEAGAKARQRAALRQGSSPLGSIEPDGGRSAEKAAEAAGVSTSAVKRAKRVVESGTPELQAAAAGGGLSLSAAADLADLPLEEQAEVLAQGAAAAVETAKRVREARAAMKQAAPAEPGPSPRELLHRLEALVRAIAQVMEEGHEIPESIVMPFRFAEAAVKKARAAEEESAP